MVSKVFSLECVGLEVVHIEIEVDILRGLPGIAIIGLADAAVKESKHRMQAAIKNSGFEFPAKKIIVNLAPGNIHKTGTHYDLAIAVGWLNSNFQTNIQFQNYYIVGELSLDGKIRAVDGILPMVLKAKAENKKIIVPYANRKEAFLVDRAQVYPVKNLSQVYNLLLADEGHEWVTKKMEITGQQNNYEIDFKEVRSQKNAKRAMEVAAAGLHNILMIGPPGVGKTMLAARLATILPNMSEDETMEITKIHSIAGTLKADNPVMRERPFRAPHHTSSHISLVGGGAKVVPGEITLAHRGVLFLDELPEFNRQALEALRQPLENGEINIARAQKRLTFPSNFLFVAAMNPCPCGYLTSKEKTCRCTTYQIQKYRSKISGPLLDRIDIHVELADIRVETILENSGEREGSSEIKKRVEEARARQKKRFKVSGIFNARIKNKDLRRFCEMTPKAENILKRAIKHFSFSARAYTKILKVARTIADIEGFEKIREENIAEAVQYRSLDKSLWL